VAGGLALATRPRSIQLYMVMGPQHVFLFKQLHDILPRLIFCVLYDKVSYCKELVEPVEPGNLPPECPISLTQFITGNKDNDIATLDGRGSFSGMEIIIPHLLHIQQYTRNGLKLSFAE
jgi:hypothetical protein